MKRFVVSVLFIVVFCNPLFARNGNRQAWIDALDPILRIGSVKTPNLLFLGVTSNTSPGSIFQVLSGNSYQLAARADVYCPQIADFVNVAENATVHTRILKSRNISGLLSFLPVKFDAVLTSSSTKSISVEEVTWVDLMTLPYLGFVQGLDNESPYKRAIYDRQNYRIVTRCLRLKGLAANFDFSKVLGFNASTSFPLNNESVSSGSASFEAKWTSGKKLEIKVNGYVYLFGELRSFNPKGKFGNNIEPFGPIVASRQRGGSERGAGRGLASLNTDFRRDLGQALGMLRYDGQLGALERELSNAKLGTGVGLLRK